MEEENGEKNLIARKPNNCNIFPGRKRENASYWGICNYRRDYISQRWARNKAAHRTWGNPIIYFVLSVKLYSPFVPSFSLSLCFSADSTDSLQAEEKLPPSTAVEFLSVGNRGPSSRNSVTNSYRHQKSTKR